MTATLTSRLAFHAITSERDIQAQRLLKLYEEQGPLSDREACYRLNWEAPSVVSARRNDLKARGLVVEWGKAKDPNTGKLVSRWAVVKDTLW